MAAVVVSGRDAADWTSLQNVRGHFPSADGVKAGSGTTMTVFNVGGVRPHVRIHDGGLVLPVICYVKDESPSPWLREVPFYAMMTMRSDDDGRTWLPGCPCPIPRLLPVTDCHQKRPHHCHYTLSVLPHSREP